MTVICSVIIAAPRFIDEVASSSGLRQRLSRMGVEVDCNFVAFLVAADSRLYRFKSPPIVSRSLFLIKYSDYTMDHLRFLWKEIQ